MNKYYCSNGERVTEAVIKTRLSKAYKAFYIGEPLGFCEGCGDRATCTAHIIPKSVCKTLHKTELIWMPVNWFRSCYKCNMVAENPSSVKTLNNYERILEVTKEYDYVRYLKMTI